MRSIFAIFAAEMRQLTKNVVTVMIVLGLAILPSLFTWYNVLSCWNVFDNTGNLTVAVANTDEGYKSDLFPLDVNIGENVVSALRENDQINWVFTTEEDAMDGVYSGKYYASVIIPSGFSRSMLTFYQDDGEQAPLVYYTNEKINAIAPKITDQGADGVSYQINKTFSETLSDIAITIAQSISEYADTASAQSTIGTLTNSINQLADEIDEVAGTLSSYESLTSSSKTLLTSVNSLLSQTQNSANEIAGITDSSISDAKTSVSALETAADNLSDAISATIKALDDIDDIEPDISDQTSAQETADELRKQAQQLDEQIDAYQTLRDKYAQESQDAQDETLNAEIIAKLDASIESMEKLRDSLNTTADAIEAGQVDVDPSMVISHKEAAKEALEALQSVIDEKLRPELKELSNEISALYSNLSGLYSNLDTASSEVQSSISNASSRLDGATGEISTVVSNLENASSKLRELYTKLTDALESGDLDQLKEILSNDANILSIALTEPVEIERHAVFESENFGSSMFPLYSTIGLFVGALLIMVAVKPRSSAKVLDAVKEKYNVKPRHEFFGHFGVCSVISFVQSTLLALGSIFFLGVQVEHPFLFVLCFWVASLVFTFFIYSLVVAFANLGKAIAVILLIIQVTGCNGSYPLQILPDFVQTLSPFLPATHVVSAMRAAMFGIYANDFAIQLVLVLVYLVPALLLGLWLRKPFMKFMAWYVNKVEESEMMA